MATTKGKINNPELEKVLAYQDEMRMSIKTIAEIEAAIEIQQAIIDKANSFESGLPALLSRREDLLADLVIGGASSKELTDLDEEIRIERERLNNFSSEAALTVPDAKQAIAGLRRKLETAVTGFQSLKNKKPAVLAAFLQVEVELIGAEYLQLAKGLAEKHLLLRTYGMLIKPLNGKNIISQKDLVVPLFHGLETHKGCDKSSIPGEIWDAVKDRIYPDVPKEKINQERDRIAGLGIEW